MATLPPNSEPDAQTSASDRLDSWKEIATYLKREIRTVQRWEESEALPIHRHLHRQQGSVYAFKSELDAWWKNHGAADATPADDAQPATPSSSDVVVFRAPSSLAPVADPAPPDTFGLAPYRKPPHLSPKGLRAMLNARNIISSLFALAIILAAIFLDRRSWSDPAAHRLADVALSDGRLVALNADGTIAWNYYYSRPPFVKMASKIVPDAVCQPGKPSVLVAVDWDPAHDDEVDCFTQDGKSKWAFTLADTFQFGPEHFGPPWHFSSWEIVPSAGGADLALAFHHDLWWPGVVVFVDSRGRPTHRFVNSGWVLQLRKEETSLGTVMLASGVTNSHDAAFIAVLDPNLPDGTSPEDPGSKFECENCPSGHPLKYFVFPRSEVSVATGAPRDQSGVEEVAGDIIFRTYETQLGGPHRPAEAIYKVSRNLEILSATYGDAYWDVHRELEVAKIITHNRAQCPDRDGPRLVREWTPQNGWRDIQLNSSESH